MASGRLERIAWHEYLMETQDLTGSYYLEVEETAWKHLQAKLAQIRRTVSPAKPRVRSRA